MATTTKERLLTEADRLLKEGTFIQRALDKPYDERWIDRRLAGRWDAACRHLFRVIGSRAREFADSFGDANSDQRCDEQGYARRFGVTEALFRAINDDMLFDVEHIVAAELFADLLEQAQHLQSNGYFIAAGTLGRAVLEEHLRKLSAHHGCLPQKQRPTINDYNDALYGVKVYDKIILQHVTALAAIGNDCAHNTGNATNDDVTRLLRDVRDFVRNYPV